MTSWGQLFEPQSTTPRPQMTETRSHHEQSVRKLAFARAGLIGNPSDGFNGKTISIIVRNFQAEVTLERSQRLEICRADEDEDRFDSISALADHVKSRGYYGGTRLLKGAIKRFYEYVSPVHSLSGPNFSISFCSNIPRQVGLAGSSAIITAALRGLI